MAAKQGDTKNMEFLVEQKADVNIKDNEGV